MIRFTGKGFGFAGYLGSYFLIVPFRPRNLLPAAIGGHKLVRVVVLVRTIQFCILAFSGH